MVEDEWHLDSRGNNPNPCECARKSVLRPDTGLVQHSTAASIKFDQGQTVNGSLHNTVCVCVGQECNPTASPFDQTQNRKLCMQQCGKETVDREQHKSQPGCTSIVAGGCWSSLRPADIRNCSVVMARGITSLTCQ